MKKLLCILAITSLLSFQIPSPVELAGTSWRGKVLMPESTTVIMKFREGVVCFYESRNSQHLIATVQYEQNSSFIVLHSKLAVSSCSKAGSWLYHIEKSQRGINFLILDNPCGNKANLLTGGLFTELDRNGVKE